MCPNNGHLICYALEIETLAVIMAEDIEAHCLGVGSEYHEAIADAAFIRFGGRQTLTASHGRVAIVTVRE